jgi:hypothetical protein
MSKRTISNSDDVIDSRDVIARIEELQANVADDTITADEDEELQALLKLADEGADDWEHGVALIRNSYFATYAEELADDLGAVPADASWPLTCIDWEQAARELQGDYTALDFDGVTYWVR